MAIGGCSLPFDDFASPDGPVGECEPGATRVCFDGEAASLEHPPCAAGASTCDDGGQWGACLGQVLPASQEDCGTSADDNCNGEANEGCACTTGETQACYSGPTETRDVGACADGTQTCVDGAWSACEGETLPTDENCTGLSDDMDCDGIVANLDGCACEDLATEPCYEGDAATLGVGICSDGQRTCDAGVWGACLGQVLPLPAEDCATLADDDCNGTLDPCDCLLGETNKCTELSGGGTVDADLIDIGVCKAGTQTCVADGAGSAWSACQGAVGPSVESCSTTDDEDCDDEEGHSGFDPGNGCVCAPGEAVDCYSGDLSDEIGGASRCRVGINTCLPSGTDWGGCSGEVLPIPEDCSTPTDEDCDGTETQSQPDNDCACIPGATTTDGCAAYPDEFQNLLGNGTCAVEQRTCPDGTAWSACQPAVLPATEICNGQDDEDCDGTIDNDCPNLSLSAGGAHTCAVTPSGALWCWGDNAYGQLGATPSPQILSGVPVEVDLANVEQVSAGEDFTCALLAMEAPHNGKVYCFGRNHYGQLGNGTFTDSRTPVEVDGLVGVTRIAAGAAHACAIVANDGVWCWGNNETAQLGTNPSAVPSSADPLLVPNLTDVTEIAAGAVHSCALASGALYCWGNNFRAELGLDPTAHSQSPVPLSPVVTPSSSPIGLALGATEYSAGPSGHGCIIDADLKPRCWGAGKYGQAGTGDDKTFPPTVVGTLSGIVALSAGGLTTTNSGHSCALEEAGSVYCWGHSASRQLGVSSQTATPNPVVATIASEALYDVVGAESIPLLAAGGRHTCASSQTGKVYCWGRAEEGQLGNGTEGGNPTHLPQEVEQLPNP